MGDRSNTNIIMDVIEIKEEQFYKVLNVYSHSKGTEAQLSALNWFINYGKARIDNENYFSRGVIMAVCEGNVKETGSGVDIRVCDSIKESARQFLDNEHLILTFNLIDHNIILSDEKNIIETFPLTVAGAEKAKISLLEDF